MANPWYDPLDYMWPDRNRARPLAPIRVGMDRITGKVIMGQRHEDQSIGVIFATRFHERVLRRWVGSFVPHLLGELATMRIVARFFWAVATALDLWEPNVRIRQVWVVNKVDPNNPNGETRVLTSAEELRTGQITFRIASFRRPRGHLGDFTAEQRRTIGLIGSNGAWEVQT